MKIVVLRFTNNLATARFVLSNPVAEDLLNAFEAVKMSSRYQSPVIRIVDEDQPLPPLQGLPEGRTDFRRQEGCPGSVSIVDLTAVSSVRVIPFEPYATEWNGRL